jgi:hypothetical protein
MNIPACPNHREGKCAKSDTVHGGETKDGGADIIICRTCKLLWMISKPKTSQRAAYENKLERMQKATERDRQAARKRVMFDMGRRR